MRQDLVATLIIELDFLHIYCRIITSHNRILSIVHNGNILDSLRFFKLITLVHTILRLSTKLHSIDIDIDIYIYIYIFFLLLPFLLIIYFYFSRRLFIINKLKNIQTI